MQVTEECTSNSSACSEKAREADPVGFYLVRAAKNLPSLSLYPLRDECSKATLFPSRDRWMW